jgi:hypothetical protein
LDEGGFVAAAEELLLVKEARCPSENEFSTRGLRSFRRLPELLLSLCLESRDESMDADFETLFGGKGSLGWLALASSFGLTGCLS